MDLLKALTSKTNVMYDGHIMSRYSCADGQTDKRALLTSLSLSEVDEVEDSAILNWVNTYNITNIRTVITVSHILTYLEV